MPDSKSPAHSPSPPTDPYTQKLAELKSQTLPDTRPPLRRPSDPGNGSPYANINDELRELSIFDHEKPWSLINLVSTEFAEFMKKIPAEYFALSETEFIEKFKPDETDYRLRLRFWDEWQISLLQSRNPIPIRIPTVHYGVCTREYFYQRVLKDPAKLCWLIMPPTDYQTTLKELLYRGLSRLREILQLPFVTEEIVIHKGQPVLDPATRKPITRRKVDKGLVTEVRQVIAMLSDRVHGAIVNRIDVKQQNLTMSVSKSISATVENDPLPSLPLDMLKQLDAQIDSIDAKLKPLEIESHVILDAKSADALRSLGIDPATIDESEVGEISNYRRVDPERPESVD